MGDFTRIEIHFRDPAAGDRRAVILPTSGVQAIFLRGSESTFLKIRGSEREPKEVTRGKKPGPPKGLTLEGQVHPDNPGLKSVRGPGEVCYLVDDVLECWKPS